MGRLRTHLSLPWERFAVLLVLCALVPLWTGCRTLRGSGASCPTGHLSSTPLQLPNEPGSGDPLEGISALSTGPNGDLWMAPERQRLLVRLPPDGQGTPTYVDLQGVPKGHDTESLAWLPDGRLAIGTERIAHRKTDPILLARLAGETMIVEDTLPFSYKPWGVKAKPNRGLEGLTQAGAWLVAASEMVLDRDGRRHAPLGAYHLTEERWERTTLPLSTDTGRLSGISCEANPEGGLECLAIERHYGVSRLLRFVLSPPLTQTVEITCIQDLAPSIGSRTNIEGILRASDGQITLVNDNSSDPDEVPTWLMRPTAPQDLPAPP